MDNPIRPGSLTRTPSSHTSASAQSSGILTTMEKRIVGYIRVSTKMQAESGLSLDAQEETIRRYARQHNLKLSEVIVDAGQSAKDLNREGIKKVIKGLAADEIGTVIVCKFDRLSRSLLDFFGLVEKYFSSGDRQLISISESFDTRSTAGRLIVPMIVLFGQWERQQTSERTRAALKHLKEIGGYTGHTPFGSDKVKKDGVATLRPNLVEQKILEEMQAAYGAGKGLTEIADSLNKRQIRAKRGGIWTKHTVYGLLSRRGTIQRRTTLPNSLSYNKLAAYECAKQLRDEDRTYEYIARELTRRGYRPLKSAEYRVSSVVDLLASVSVFDVKTAFGYAAKLRGDGYSLRQIAAKLTVAGYKPPRGGTWYANSVSLLLQHGDETRVPRG